MGKHSRIDRTSRIVAAQGGGVPLGGGTGGLGLGAIVVLALIGYFTGIDPRDSHRRRAKFSPAQLQRRDPERRSPMRPARRAVATIR